MDVHQPLLNRQRILISTTLAIFLASVFMLTYSGVIESGDTMRYFDAVSSVARFGDWLYDEALNISPPLNIDNRVLYPLGRYELEETLHIYLATFLYKLADILPQIGFVHTVWLFNILVTAVSAWLLFFLAVAMGADARAAAFTVLVFGFGTIAWPYSKSFFRDPLVMPFLLAATLGILRWRQGWFWVLIALLGFIGATQAKNSALFALPALLVLLANFPPRLARWIWYSLCLLCLTPILLIYIPGILDSVAGTLQKLDVRPDFAREALHTYLFSVGGSMWGTSPIALLALPSFWLWRNQPRYIAFFVVLLMGYAFGHAFFSGVHWFGGLSWPPRFLVPLAPFAALAGLPFYQQITTRRAKWAIAVFLPIMLYSMWVQFNGVALNWSFYGEVLPESANRLSEWSPGLNSVAYLRWVLLPQYWGRFPFEFAHARAGIGAWVPGYILLGLSSLILMKWLIRRPQSAWPFFIVSSLTAFVLLTYANLRALYVADILYWSDKQALHESLDILRRQATAGDVVLLSDPTYQRFVINYNDLDTVRFIVLPLQPGERPSEKQNPEVVSANNENALSLRTIPIIDALAAQRGRLWLLANNGPFTPWAIRPVERYLTRQYHLIREHETPTTDVTVRLLEYSTIPAIDPYAQRGPLNSYSAIFGDVIELMGFDLTSGLSYDAGEVLPISLSWRALKPIEHNYNVAWFLTNTNTGVPLTQGFDSAPSGGFALTTTWIPNVPIWDNRALVIPTDAPAGTYEIWVLLYGLDENGMTQRLSVRGGQTREGTILVLPTPITINPPHTSN